MIRSTQGTKMSRETYFECSFTSEKTSRVAHVRAWDAHGASRIFEEALRELGLREAGTISVHDVRGRVAPLEVTFEPAAGVTRAASEAVKG